MFKIIKEAGVTYKDRRIFHEHYQQQIVIVR